MDLFGTKRRNATQAAVEYVRPLLGTIQHIYGLPPGFWHDEFVIGFVGYSFTFVTKSTAPTLSAESGGTAMIDAFTAISNQNGAAIAERMIALSKDPTDDFRRAVENAATLFHFCAGRIRNEETDPDVVAATELATALGGARDRAAVAGALAKLLFNNEILKRFNLR